MMLSCALNQRFLVSISKFLEDDFNSSIAHFGQDTFKASKHKLYLVKLDKVNLMARVGWRESILGIHVSKATQAFPCLQQ